ncbi:glycine--tRNA ligase subunit beta [Croceicoccus gelatinilyticus]|uniref:glycine--tRNA ligase subunit beta n=1 Tax=Croceicoccus gelatinilyticus TaxID=2835536 RepID=UPI001BCEC271|nr:glycine--tRNA ligase subunit beta [Croceicoccus gelatinilyticus]MBS7668842.1 glycine--tRNA ligase subunit beta [Croceicoccus gelatinilyticus]
MTDFLLELRSEEIPARMQAGARADLERLFREQMKAAGVEHGAITVWSTPRRLALIAKAMPQQTEAVSEEAKGPPEGAPDQAIDGFCKKNGVTRDQLEVRDVKGRATYFAVKNIPGRDVKDVLAEAIPAIVRAFPWPKSMRWGEASISTESLRWVRPLSGIVAILGEELVGCEVGGVASGYATLGHRFHHSGEITIGGADDYAEKLRACHVIVDHEERQDMVRAQAQDAASAAGLELVADEGLVIENAGLTEWPVPLLGRFDESYLDVPPEVIQLTARTNQKYFVCNDANGALANAFVCTANIAAEDPAVIVDGNRKVLAARLSDARFFWEVDQKTTLAEHAKKLERITFHEKLGTVADKVQRVAKLARWLAEEGVVPGADADMTEMAALLCKADLVTEMVGEFPELQGLMGGYYARAEGLPDAVSDAIRDHYKPVGQGDDVPTAPVTVGVSLADKLDTLRSFFAIDEKPTGSKDPFALRRAALAVIRLVTANNLRMAVADGDLLDFFADRLKVQQKEAGVRHDLIDAVFALGGEDDLVRLLARVKALQSFMDSEDGSNLLAGYKRAANILKKEGYEGTDRIARTGEEDPLALVDDPDVGSIVAERGKSVSYDREPAEQALVDALAQAEPAANAAIAGEDFGAAMAALATLRAPIDAFFDDVTVNDADPAKRSARLALLANFVAAVHKVADFSRIEG